MLVLSTSCLEMTPMELRWEWRRFDELTVEMLYAILGLRQLVFIVEQTCAYLDVDGRDLHAEHLCGWTPQGELAAYLRIVVPGERFPEPSIGRVVTHPSWRKCGAGKELMREGLRRCGQLYPGLPVRISAQKYLERFYTDLGFVTEGEGNPYDEDGIPHIEMIYIPSPENVTGGHEQISAG